MMRAGNQAMGRSGDRIQILHVLGELDLATADGLAARGCDAFAHTWLLLLDLSDLSFCDARGLSALVRIANHADMTGGRCALIAPQPQVAKLLLICRLTSGCRYSPPSMTPWQISPPQPAPAHAKDTSH